MTGDSCKVLKGTERMEFENGHPFPAKYTIFGDGIAFEDLDDDHAGVYSMLYWEDIIPYIPKSLLNKAGTKVPQHLTYKKTDANIDMFTES